jgi:tetratricopeptide (TPR) repeat protein
MCGVGRYAAAEGDCTIAIGLDPSYAKAYFRRASARGSLGRHSEAAQDLRRLLSLDAVNREAKTELARLEKVHFECYYRLCVKLVAYTNLSA